MKNNELGISVECAIREYKKYRNEEYLGYLLKSLINEPLFITAKPYDEIMISETSETSIPVVAADKMPSIVVSDNNKFWLSSFTDKKKIPASFLKDNIIMEISLKDLIDKSLVYIYDIESYIEVNEKEAGSNTKQIYKDLDILFYGLAD